MDDLRRLILGDGGVLCRWLGVVGSRASDLIRRGIVVLNQTATAMYEDIALDSSWTGVGHDCWTHWNLLWPCLRQLYRPHHERSKRSRREVEWRRSVLRAVAHVRVEGALLMIIVVLESRCSRLMPVAATSLDLTTNMSIGSRMGTVVTGWVGVTVVFLLLLRTTVVVAIALTFSRLVRRPGRDWATQHRDEGSRDRVGAAECLLGDVDVWEVTKSWEWCSECHTRDMRSRKKSRCDRKARCRIGGKLAHCSGWGLMMEV